jgi:hypothetical protein
MQSKVRLGSTENNGCLNSEYVGYVSERMRFIPGSESDGSFIGGRPLWAGNADGPEIVCSECGSALVQVTQMWAPLEGLRRRSLHLFVCAQCRDPPGQWRAFRSQTSDPFSDSEDEEDGGKKTQQQLVQVPAVGFADVDDATLDALLAANAVREKKKPTKKKKSKKKKARKKELPVWEGCEIQPCWLDVVEKRPPKRAAVSEKQADEAAAALERLVLEAAKDKESWGGEEFETGSRESKTFRVFQKALGRDPSRVVRYQRDGAPLWISEPPPSDTPPDCARCGARTVFEMQLLPTLLYLGGTEGLWQEKTAGDVVPEEEEVDDGLVVDEAASEMFVDVAGQKEQETGPAAALPELIRTPVPEYGVVGIFCCPKNCGDVIVEERVRVQLPE